MIGSGRNTMCEMPVVTMSTSR